MPPQELSELNSDELMDVQDKLEPYNPSQEERQALLRLQKRERRMLEKRKELDIEDKIDRMDELFTPHFIVKERGLDQSLVEFDDRRVTNLEALDRRKSKPLAFRKVTTAQATMIKENPKVKAKAYKEKYKHISLLAEKSYEENWAANKSIRELRRVVRDMAKYGFGYARRYIKRRWKISHTSTGRDENGVIQYKRERNYKVNDVVFERWNPKDVVLDDACTSPRDANDCFIYVRFRSEQAFRSAYPQNIYEKAKFVKLGVERTIVEENNKSRITTKRPDKTDEKEILVKIYQNCIEGIQEVTAGGVYLDKSPLPAGELGLVGAKWNEDRDNYDAIGIGQVIEIYQPLVDDILNASNERLRQLVRPVRHMGNDVKYADDSSQEWDPGVTVHIEGDIDQLKWDRPPATTQAELAERDALDKEIDLSVGVNEGLEGLDQSETAFQAAQNREASLKRLSLPLDEIKDMLEDDANLAFSLFKTFYSQPENVEMLDRDNEEFVQAQEILRQNPNDERFIEMDDGRIARRRFKQMELNLSKEIIIDSKTMKPIDTGRVVESEEKEFWEMIPSHFNWEGYLNIVAMSFLPVSKALEDQRVQTRTEFLLNIPTADDEGNPILKDASGRPYTVDKVRAIKDWLEIEVDPDKYVVPIEEPNQDSGDVESPLDIGADRLSSREQLGLKSPELGDISNRAELPR